MSSTRLPVRKDFRTSLAKVLETKSLIGFNAPYCNICSGIRESDSKLSLSSVGNCLIVQLNRFFVSTGTFTKNSAPFFVSSSTEMVTEIEDEVFCTRKFNLAAIINHSRNRNSGRYTCLVKDGETRRHSNDKAVVPVNMNDKKKSLPYVLFYQTTYFFCFFVFCDFCVSLQGGLTDYNLSYVGGSSLHT